MLFYRHHSWQIQDRPACRLLSWHKPSCYVVFRPIPSPLHYIVLLVLLLNPLSHVCNHLIRKRNILFLVIVIIFLQILRYLWWSDLFFLFLGVILIFLVYFCFCTFLLLLLLCSLLLLSSFFFLLILLLFFTNNDSLFVVVNFYEGSTEYVSIKQVKFFLL